MEIQNITAVNRRGSKYYAIGQEVNGMIISRIVEC